MSQSGHSNRLMHLPARVRAGLAAMGSGFVPWCHGAAVQELGVGRWSAVVIVADY